MADAGTEPRQQAECPIPVDSRGAGHAGCPNLATVQRITPFQGYAQTGVILNTLAPGLIDTDRIAGRKSLDAHAWASYVARANWMGHAGHVDEMVGAALFLSAQVSSFMTGEVLTLSGGY
ncbi:SDR family oxidoreductase [Shimia sp.]|uniref:SDR family oxidoreductase n=1 Tax=Shimia sp. TaxID=1954381 RepID=UPI00329A4487